MLGKLHAATPAKRQPKLGVFQTFARKSAPAAAALTSAAVALWVGWLIVWATEALKGSPLTGCVNNSGAILLAEDNPDDVLLFRLALKKSGRQNPLLVVPDGRQALLYLKGEDQFSDRTQFPLPQLLVLDLKMPGLSGFEVLSWVRQQAHFKGLPVVVLTTSSFEPDVKQAYTMGANSFLTKPLDFEEFVEAVKQMTDYWIDLCRIPEPPPPPPPWNQPSASAPDS